MKALSDENVLVVIAENVKRLRNGTSYSELARRANTYPTSIERIEKGKHMPGAGLLSRLAQALGTTPDVLLTEPSNDTPKKSRRSA